MCPVSVLLPYDSSTRRELLILCSQTTAVLCDRIKNKITRKLMGQESETPAAYTYRRVTRAQTNLKNPSKITDKEQKTIKQNNEMARTIYQVPVITRCNGERLLFNTWYQILLIEANHTYVPEKDRYNSCCTEDATRRRGRCRHKDGWEGKINKEGRDTGKEQEEPEKYRYQVCM